MENVHQIILTDRNHLAVTKLSEIVSFDDTTVNLDVGGTYLTVSGSNLTVKKLSLDEKEGSAVIIEGTVDAVVYTDTQRRKRRLFG
ncbi:MAG TPA: YabP/YqfC family sporulation protein [Bacillota bacterium]|nr:YabP/YqfC family sporulation protein [Bacillota bacterium]